MGLLQNIKNSLFPKAPQPITWNTPFIFPYPDDKELKRQQVWENLEKGLLFEDTKILIPWSTSFTDINRLAEQRKDSGDRTNWFLGKHQILDGYMCYVGVMKWIFIKDSNPFAQIEEWLGLDAEGNEKFLFLKDKFTDLLGEPSLQQLEKFGNFDLGSIEWTYQKVKVRLSGIEQFECKYRLYVGLADNPNW